MLVSVVIPMYNREKTIKMAVDSVLTQTYQNLELIVVDDCSTDNSVNVVREIKDARLRVITCKKNGGACIARNIGIENAKGEIIAFQDSDDCWHKDKLEKSLYYLDKEKADLVFSALVRKEGKNVDKNSKIHPTYNLNNEYDKLSRLLVSNCVSTQTIVAKREVFETIRFDRNLPRFQDWDVAIQIVKKGYRVFFIDEPLVDCFIMNNSITSDCEKAIYSLRILESKYSEDYRRNSVAREKFFYLAACFLERNGRSGAEYFWKAYESKKNKGMLLRYILARIGVYRKILLRRCFLWGRK